MTMFFVPIPEPDLNRSSRRIRTALLDIVDALAPVDINYHKKKSWLFIPFHLPQLLLPFTPP